MNDMTPIPSQLGLGVHPNIPNDVYHSGPGVSKSGLWTIHTKSPAHYKFPPPRDEDSTTAKATKDFGSAAHIAILEPERLEAGVFKGPEDRRGNPWKDAVSYAEGNGMICLVAKDYDNMLALRDTVHANQRINSLITGSLPHVAKDKPEVEYSGYWIDPETGELCRCRPDLYRPDMKIMIDLKSTESAHPEAFARSVVNYGYHAQEAFYSDGYRALDREVEGFLFLAWEKKSPFAFGLYELPPSIVDEGRAIMRQALGRYAECQKNNHWPSYSEDVTELSFKRWNYALTDAPLGEDAEAA